MLDVSAKYFYRCLSYDTATHRAQHVTPESPPLSFSAESKGVYLRCIRIILEVSSIKRHVLIL